MALASLALVAGGGGHELIGASVEHRPIDVQRFGSADAERTVLVVGSIHGDETQGHRIVRWLGRHQAPRLDDVELLLVRTVNPDGVAADTRGNAHSVDLNRNFPYQWKPIPPSSGYYSGPKPATEPETKAVRKFVRREDPDITVWYHQPWNRVLVPCGSGAGRRVALRYAHLSGMKPRDCYPSPPGSATGWQRAKRDEKAFVVELPSGRLGDSAVKRHARALAKIAEPG